MKFTITDCSNSVQVLILHLSYFIDTAKEYSVFINLSEIVKQFLKAIEMPLSNFSCMFLISIFFLFEFYLLEYIRSRNNSKKHFFQKFVWPLIVRKNCSCDLKMLANSWHSASNFKTFFSITVTNFFLTENANIFRWDAAHPLQLKITSWNRLPFF